MGILIVQANSITFKDGKILMEKNSDDSFSIPGGPVLEGESLEEACKNRSTRAIKIIKPLHPKICWKDFGSKKIPIISINYLTEVKNV